MNLGEYHRGKVLFLYIITGGAWYLNDITHDSNTNHFLGNICQVVLTIVSTFLTLFCILIPRNKLLFPVHMRRGEESYLHFWKVEVCIYIIWNFENYIFKIVLLLNRKDCIKKLNIWGSPYRNSKYRACDSSWLYIISCS